MINVELVHNNEFSCDNENTYDNAKNTITFDCENLIIKTFHDGENKMSILFEINPQLIKEIRMLMDIIEEEFKDV